MAQHDAHNDAKDTIQQRVKHLLVVRSTHAAPGYKYVYDKRHDVLLCVNNNSILSVVRSLLLFVAFSLSFSLSIPASHFDEIAHFSDSTRRLKVDTGVLCCSNGGLN